MNWLKIKQNIFFRRSLGFIWHLAGIYFCYWLAFGLKFDFLISEKNANNFHQTIPIAIVAYVSGILLFRLYRGLWRFFTVWDFFMTIGACIAGTSLLALGVLFRNGGEFGPYPRSVLLINLLLIIGWEVGGRAFVRLLREWKVGRTYVNLKRTRRTLLVGGIDECHFLLRSLQRQQASLGRVVAIVSDDTIGGAATLQHIPITEGLDTLLSVAEKRRVNNILFMPPFHTAGTIREAVDSMTKASFSPSYRVMPSMDDIAEGRVSVNEIRKVEIEDLLDREAYDVNTERLRDFVTGKRVIVTGAGGSIGSEICRQLIHLLPGSLALVDSSEFALFQIERELKPIAEELGVILFAFTGDVRREDAMERCVQMSGGVDLVYHAAAYKHVDLMERNAPACFHNNAIGTMVMAKVAEKAGATDFVLVSTDKAVRPTSLMGASKRLAERILMERPESRTRFKAVRFGNVLGSSGSVIPIFREQIANGGPVTVTSRSVTRFFMTIPEASELVLAASSISEDRRIFVLEMGEPVRIDRMAHRMIELSGFVPDVDIPIVYSGLKPGEKEYEELLTNDENVERTDDDRIWVVAKNDGVFLDEVDIGELLELIDSGEEAALRDFAHSHIPESKLYDSESSR